MDIRARANQPRALPRAPQDPLDQKFEEEEKMEGHEEAMYLGFRVNRAINGAIGDSDLANNGAIGDRDLANNGANSDNDVSNGDE